MIIIQKIAYVSATTGHHHHHHHFLHRITHTNITHTKTRPATQGALCYQRKKKRAVMFMYLHYKIIH
jgi:hypothetical protein